MVGSPHSLVLYYNPTCKGIYYIFENYAPGPTIWYGPTSQATTIKCMVVIRPMTPKIRRFQPLISLIGPLYYIDSGNQQFLDLVEALLFVCCRLVVVGATRPWAWEFCSFHFIRGAYYFQGSVYRVSPLSLAPGIYMQNLASTL